jgi:hypothetical protein
MTAPKPSRPTRLEIERWVYAIVDRVFAQLEAGT